MLNSLFRQCRFWATCLGSPGPLATGVSPPGDRRSGLLQASPRGERKFPPRCIWHIHKAPKSHPIWAPIVAFFLTGTALGAPPGTIISNQASVAYENSAGIPSLVVSNEVQLVTAVIRSPASLVFSRVVTSGTFQESVGAAACFQSGAFVNLPDPTISGGLTIDPSLTQDVSVTSSYNLGEPFMLRLGDADQNIDAAVRDTATVVVSHPLSGDTETIRLTETGIDSGIFAGYVPSMNAPASPGDCVLQGSMDTEVRVNYTDPADATDFAAALASLDPISVVFDSRSGALIDGASVQIIDVSSGLPAIVYGNDGVSIFPSTIVSGESAVDSGGTSYSFVNGQYRFPSVPAGDYRIDVTPPGAYTSPSGVAVAELQLLPNAPFNLGPASFANSFTLGGGGPFSFDYPVDPPASALFLRKSTTTTIAAPGDFVRYELVVENTSTTDTARTVQLMDQLPSGVRYVAGSATLNGVALADPDINSATMELAFSAGNLAGGQRSVVAYVVEIVAGAKNEELVNTAIALAEGGIVSNASEARIRLAEDLFRSSSTLIGRVVEGSCALASFEEDRGVANVRVYLEDGRYAVTDAGGRFHFEGLRPGGHVAQLDTATIPEYFDIVGCTDQGRFAGRGHSQFVELSRGSLQRADFYLRRKLAPDGRINIELTNSGTDVSDEVHYELKLSGAGSITVSNLSVRVLLPDGVSYVPGSLSAGGDSAIVPRITGQSLTIALDDQSGDWNKVIRFKGVIVADVSGDLRTRALARFNSPVKANQQTPIAETLIRREAATFENEDYVLNLQFGVLSDQLSSVDREALDLLVEKWSAVRDVRIAATGHSDSTPIAAGNRARFADNYVLSQARAHAAADYVAQALDVAAANIQVDGVGPDDPVADNGSAGGRQENRRVEMTLTGRRPGKQSFLSVKQASSGTLITKTRGLPPSVAEATQQMLDEQALADHLTPPKQLEAHINSQAPGIGWVLPEAEFRPAIPALKISIKHALDQTVALFINGLEVNPLNFEGTEINTGRSVAVSRWVGVDLLTGSNRLVADIIGADGRVLDRLVRTVHYAGAPIRGELLGELSLLIADGRTRPVLAVRLYDRFGQPARHSSVGAFSIDQPYRSWWAVENDRKNKIVNIGNREPLYTVGRDGIALIELEPTTTSGMATLRLKFDQHREQELTTWLKPQPRDWILVGFGEGTVGYNTLKKNATAATRAGYDNGYYDEGRLAFFAKGRIKGEYLLTLAYDSARDSEDAKRRFETEIDPNEYYTLYADNSEQRFEASSQRKLYVKLERNQFVALFGDYGTGLSTTELGRYERRFNGFKTDYHGQNLLFSAFASETEQSFVRDELQGDGTSGLYRLSSAPIIGNSETIRIEVRDRFDTANVLSSTTLSRFLDYNLDPFNGTLYFKKPIPSRDNEFNLIYIVAEYETSSAASNDLVAGGRVALRDTGKTIEVGLTYINEGQQGAQGDLTGVDLRWQVNDATMLRAELAQSNSESGGSVSKGRAQLLGIEHRSDKLDLRAHYKEVDQAFGLEQQSAAEKGIRKFGVDARYAYSTEISLHVKAIKLKNLETGADRLAAAAEVQYQGDRSSASLGLVHAQDDFSDGVSRTTDVIQGGVSRRLFNSALKIRANGSVGIGAAENNGDYLASYVLGFDYEVMPGVDIFLEFENAESADIQSEMTRVGVRASPWSRAQIHSSFVNETSEFGPRLFANLGLMQGFQVNESWSVDIGLDRTKTLSGPGLRRFDEERELAFGSQRDDFTAAFLGTLYQSEYWSVNSRIEYRHSDSEKRRSLISGWYREPGLGHGMSAGLSIYHSETSDASDSLTVDARMGWAFRPAESSWSILDRIDLIYEKVSSLISSRRSWRLINNLNTNKRIGASSQLAMQYAFKYVRSEFDTTDVTGYTDLTGLDFSKGFAQKWQAGIHASAYHAYASSIVDYGFGIDIGLNVRDNMWLTLGYNVSGFYDEDFAAARYTAQGPYFRISIKADQETLKRIAGR